MTEPPLERRHTSNYQQHTPNEHILGNQSGVDHSLEFVVKLARAAKPGIEAAFKLFKSGAPVCWLLLAAKLSPAWDCRLARLCSAATPKQKQNIKHHKIKNITKKTK